MMSGFQVLSKAFFVLCHHVFCEVQVHHFSCSKTCIIHSFELKNVTSMLSLEDIKSYFVPLNVGLYNF